VSADSMVLIESSSVLPDWKWLSVVNIDCKRTVAEAVTRMHKSCQSLSRSLEAIKLQWNDQQSFLGRGTLNG
jgi:hypothetical protein